MSYDIERRAKRKVKAIKGFYIHFFIYAVMGLFFFFMNMLTDPFDVWFFFPMLPWGVGLSIHYLVVFGIPGTKILSAEWEERELEKQISRLESGTTNHLEYRELSESEALELRQLQRDYSKGGEEDFV